MTFERMGSVEQTWADPEYERGPRQVAMNASCFHSVSPSGWSKTHGEVAQRKARRYGRQSLIPPFD